MVETKIRDEYNIQIRYENDECCTCVWNEADASRENSKGREGIVQHGKSSVFMQLSIIGKRQGEMIKDMEKLSSGS